MNGRRIQLQGSGRARFCGAWLLLWLCVCGANGLAQKTATTGGARWRRLPTAQFTLVGNVEEKALRRTAHEIEDFRGAFNALHKLSAEALPTAPVTVLVFNSAAEYQRYRPGAAHDASGFSVRNNTAVYLALAAGARGSQHSDEVVFHEFAHYLIDQHLSPDLPIWLSEGLADYYSTLKRDARGTSVSVGKPPAMYLRELNGNAWLSWKALLAADRNAPLLREHQLQFYMQSWLLAHRLLARDTPAVGLARLRAFIAALRKSGDADATLHAVYGITTATLEREMPLYLAMGARFARSYTLTSGSNSPLASTTGLTAEVETLGAGAALAYLGDLLRVFARYADAAGVLERAVELEPDDAHVNAALGWLRVEQKRFAEARGHLERAVRAAPREFLWHYLYAYAVSRENVDTLGGVPGYLPAQAELIENELRASIALNPSFAEAHYLRAFVLLAGDRDLELASDELGIAAQLAPQREQYRLLLAQILLRRNDFARAREVLTVLRDGAAQTETRERAATFLAWLPAMEERAAREERERAQSRAAQRALARQEVTGEMSDELYNFAAALRPLKTDEARVSGQLRRIDCDAGGLFFELSDEAGRLLHFNARELRQVSFRSFTPQMKGRIQCGALPAPVPHVIFTYRPPSAPNGSKKSSADGEAVAVEFVPPEFKLPPDKN